uniref:Ig-like domain-containing protein n=1 Tax=Haplochromis burtoni TaxID=8153 RepID=A0A3Q2W0P1_HAPBU
VIYLSLLIQWFLFFSDEQELVKVREGSKSVILPCETKPNLSEDTTVEWTRSDLGLIMVDAYPNRKDDPMTQDDLYANRTKMNEDLLRTGDLSLTLKKPTQRDSGGYICTIYRDKDILRQKVVLQVKGHCCRYKSEVSAADTDQKSYLFHIKCLHRTICTLGQPSGGYRRFPGSPGNILSKKQVELKVRGQCCVSYRLERTFI